MKTETLNNMRKAVEVLAAFGDAKSTTQVKKYMALEAAITKIEGTTQKAREQARLLGPNPNAFSKNSLLDLVRHSIKKRPAL